MKRGEGPGDRTALIRPVAKIAYAQLFWASDQQPRFAEERSAVVLLDEWRDDVLRLDASDVVGRRRGATMSGRSVWTPSTSPG